jgi:ABC-type sugar transport system ATPase subunit
MGRAIVRDPQVFLFDEPLSNLDAKLRVQMRTEIKELHQRLKTTTVYVTHDQIEAMTMADKIVVMHDGIVEQIGAPLELYDNPANLFVAGFIGSPAMNFLPGTRCAAAQAARARRACRWHADQAPANTAGVVDGQPVICGTQPSAQARQLRRHPHAGDGGADRRRHLRRLPPPAPRWRWPSTTATISLRQHHPPAAPTCSALHPVRRQRRQRLAA